MHDSVDKFDLDALRERLELAVKASGRSMRDVSLDSGSGPGYLHSILKAGKVPKTTNLAAVCDTLGVSLLYIIYGIEASPETEQIIRRLEANKSRRDGILALLSE